MPFLRNRSQSGPCPVILSVYSVGEQTIKPTVTHVMIFKAPPNANVISRHVLYKLE